MLGRWHGASMCAYMCALTRPCVCSEIELNLNLRQTLSGPRTISHTSVDSPSTTSDLVRDRAEVTSRDQTGYVGGKVREGNSPATWRERKSVFFETKLLLQTVARCHSRVYCITNT